MVTVATGTGSRGHVACSCCCNEMVTLANKTRCYVTLQGVRTYDEVVLLAVVDIPGKDQKEDGSGKLPRYDL